MTETRTDVGSLVDEAIRRYVLNEGTFRERCKARGARTDRERCRVAGLSRASLDRWRKGVVAPSLPLLDRVIARLNLTRDELLSEVNS